MRKELVIEWRHIGEDIEHTCERCGETGAAVLDVVEQVRPLLEEEGIAIHILETVLPNEAVAESNSILFNGVLLEDLLEGVTVTPTSCTSCAGITCKENVECRAIEYEGERYDAIPPELIGRAIQKALELE